MKPDWKDAPAWANYLARDYNNQWYWYEYPPKRTMTQWRPVNGKVTGANLRQERAWENSLEERP